MIRMSVAEHWGGVPTGQTAHGCLDQFSPCFLYNSGFMVNSADFKSCSKSLLFCQSVWTSAGQEKRCSQAVVYLEATDEQPVLVHSSYELTSC